MLGLDAISWNERTRREYDEMKQASAAGKDQSEAERVKDTRPSHRLEAYTGEFEHPGYGIVTIEPHEDALQARFNALTFGVDHYHYDVFRMRHDRLEFNLKINFGANVKGDIESVAVPLESTVPDIVFQRVPPSGMREKSFLQRFTGEYELMGGRMAVALKGANALSIKLPGRQEAELVPYRGLRFVLKGLSDFTVEFKTDEAGAVMEAVVADAMGVFTAKKRREDKV
jgi:hypothetical protein